MNLYAYAQWWRGAASPSLLDDPNHFVRFWRMVRTLVCDPTSTPISVQDLAASQPGPCSAIEAGILAIFAADVAIDWFEDDNAWRESLPRWTP